MRNETITKTYLKFDELNKDQQRKVIDNVREDIHCDMEFMADDIFENYKELLTILGFDDIKIMYSGFYSQGDGACFTAKFDYPTNKKEVLSDIKKANLDYVLDDNNIKGLFNAIELQGDEFYRDEVYHVGRHYHEKSVYCDNGNVQNLVREISQIIYRELYAQNDYIHSDEYIEENINSNDYEFDSETLNII